jgi:microcystin degradation protein MlrC
MKAKKIIIAEFKHETNTFCKEKTGVYEYEKKYIKTGKEVIDYFQNTKTEIGGFIDVCTKENYEIIPVIAAQASPGGVVTHEMFEMVKSSIINTLNRETEIDGILLALHGAMVLENHPDGEGLLLESIRETVGGKIPVIATLDLHANITERMIAHVNGLFPYDFYPHTDMYERGYEAASTLVGIIKNNIKPVLKMNKLPLLAPPLRSDEKPNIDFLRMAHEWEKNKKVVSVSIAAGFPYADIYDAGLSVIVQTNNDVKLAQQIVDHMTREIMSRHKEIVQQTLPIEEAIRIGMDATEIPIVLADVSDNTGAGSPGDGTELLKKLIEMKAKNVGFASIYDPETVNLVLNSDVGNNINVILGGKSNYNLGDPIKVIANVKTITDGKFINKGPMMGSVLNNTGRTVVLDINGIEVIVTETRFQPYDPELFRRSGIEPKDKQILVVKSIAHYRAAYGEFAKQMIDVNTPGLAPPNIKNLALKNVRRPIFPLDDVF